VTAPAYATALHRARVAELKAHPRVCYWCRRAPATVVDHVRHFVEGGTHDGPWVGACVRCNARRAQRAGARLRAARRAGGYTNPRLGRARPAPAFAGSSRLGRPPLAAAGGTSRNWRP
jgi:hypothetical protein